LRKTIYIVFIFLLSCTSTLLNNKDEEVLASVDNRNLYLSDLKGVVPEGSSNSDSIAITKNFINNWIKQQLLLNKAEQNLPAEQKDFSKQLENYHNSLIIYQYETYLIQQNLDTLISTEEIESYYEENKYNFELYENIVKANFVIMDIDSIHESPVSQYLQSDNSDDKYLLEEYCKNSAKEYFFDEQWLNFNDLLMIIPIDMNNPEEFLQRNSYFEIEDSLYRYYVRFNEYKIKNSVSPLSFEEENIRNIILNKRKVQLLKNMRQEIFEDALLNNSFIIY